MPRKLISRTQKQLIAENADLRARLDESEEILRAIRNGEVDALIVSGAGGEQILTFKQVEEALRESEERFKTIFKQAPLGIALIDSLTGRIHEVNPRFAEIAGRSMEEVMSIDWMQITHPDDVQADLDKMALFNSEKINGFQMEKRYLHPDGAAVWINMTIARLKVEDKAYPRHLCMIEDISARKQSEERIRRQLEHLTALSAIDRFTAANFDLGLGLSEILTHVTMELGIDAADILILNSTSQMLEYGAERGFRGKAVRKRQVRLGESYAGRVALDRCLVQIPNLRDEPENLFPATLFTDEDFFCYFGVPLIIKGEIQGVLEVFHRAALEPDAEWFDFLNALAGQTAIAIDNSKLFESLQHSNLELSLAYDATIEGWSRALDLRDRETEGHTQRTAEMAVKLARACVLSEAELVQVRWGALLHDIGKMGVPDEILHKPGPLTDEEWVVMKKHPSFAYEMLAPIRYLRLALDIPHFHHEKWDGNGYPHKLKGVQIPFVARIFAVVDVWDALISERPYHAAWTEEKAREHIRSSSGTHFDPQVVDVFMQIVHEI